MDEQEEYDFWQEHWDQVEMEHQEQQRQAYE